MTKPTLKKPTISAVSNTDKALAFAAKKADGETARLNANIPVELHRALKMRAASERKSIGELVEVWIRGWYKT